MDARLCHLWISVIALCIWTTQAAVLPAGDTSGNSYETGGNNLDYNIEDNMIDDDYDLIRGLLPPKKTAKDYYEYREDSPKEGPVEILVLEDGRKRQGESEATLKEQPRVEDVFAGFAVFEEPKQTTTPSDVALEKVPDAVEATKRGHFSRGTIWTEMSKSMDEAMEKTTTEETPTTTTTTTEEPSATPEEEGQSAFSWLVETAWNVMRSAADYIGSFVRSLMSGSEEEAAPGRSAANTTNVTTTTAAASEAETTSAPPATTVGFFALEEPASHHRFPSEESEKRGRGIGSLLYGYGII